MKVSSPDAGLQPAPRRGADPLVPIRHIMGALLALANASVALWRALNAERDPAVLAVPSGGSAGYGSAHAAAVFASFPAHAALGARLAYFGRHYPTLLLHRHVYHWTSHDAPFLVAAVFALLLFPLLRRALRDRARALSTPLAVALWAGGWLMLPLQFALCHGPPAGATECDHFPARTSIWQCPPCSSAEIDLREHGSLEDHRGILVIFFLCPPPYQLLASCTHAASVLAYLAVSAARTGASLADASVRHPSRPLTAAALARVLRDPHYVRLACSVAVTFVAVPLAASVAFYWGGPLLRWRPWGGRRRGRSAEAAAPEGGEDASLGRVGEVAACASGGAAGAGPAQAACRDACASAAGAPTSAAAAASAPIAALAAPLAAPPPPGMQALACLADSKAVARRCFRVWRRRLPAPRYRPPRGQALLSVKLLPQGGGGGGGGGGDGAAADATDADVAALHAVARRALARAAAAAHDAAVAAAAAAREPAPAAAQTPPPPPPLPAAYLGFRGCYHAVMALGNLGQAVGAPQVAAALAPLLTQQASHVFLLDGEQLAASAARVWCEPVALRAGHPVPQEVLVALPAARVEALRAAGRGLRVVVGSSPGGGPLCDTTLFPDDPCWPASGLLQLEVAAGPSAPLVCVLLLSAAPRQEGDGGGGHHPHDALLSALMVPVLPEGARLEVEAMWEGLLAAWVHQHGCSGGGVDGGGVDGDDGGAVAHAAEAAAELWSREVAPFALDFGMALQHGLSALAPPVAAALLDFVARAGMDACRVLLEAAPLAPYVVATAHPSPPSRGDADPTAPPQRSAAKDASGAGSARASGAAIDPASDKRAWEAQLRRRAQQRLLLGLLCALGAAAAAAQAWRAPHAAAGLTALALGVLLVCLGLLR